MTTDETIRERAAYYQCRSADPSVRKRTDAELIERIADVHAGSNGTYGSPRVHRELRAGGWPAGAGGCAGSCGGPAWRAGARSAGGAPPWPTPVPRRWPRWRSMAGSVFDPTPPSAT